MSSASSPLKKNIMLWVASLPNNTCCVGKQAHCSMCWIASPQLSEVSFCLVITSNRAKLELLPIPTLGGNRQYLIRSVYLETETGTSFPFRLPRIFQSSFRQWGTFVSRRAGSLHRRATIQSCPNGRHDIRWQSNQLGSAAVLWVVLVKCWAAHLCKDVWQESPSPLPSSVVCFVIGTRREREPFFLGSSEPPNNCDMICGGGFNLYSTIIVHGTFKQSRFQGMPS